MKMEGNMRPTVRKAALGGLIGTALMTLMMYFIAPMMLGQPMDVAAMLASFMHLDWGMGMLAHFINGTVIFPLIYVFALYNFLPGSPWLKGTLWGLILWLLSQAVVMPMMGAGLFSSQAGGIMAVMGSLFGHIIYGASLGGVAGGVVQQESQA
jgi:uncharacterized membrane protein YagU involved in acid resistance